MMKLRKLLFLVILLGFFELHSYSVYAQSVTPTDSPTAVPTQAPTSAPAGATPVPTPTPDNSQQNRLNDLQSQISDLQSKISDKQSQEKTLSSQISVMNNQIKLTELKIDEAQQELNDLTRDITTTTTKISTLERSIEDLIKVLLDRIKVGYQVGESAHPFEVLLTSENAATFFVRSNYLRIAQEHDRRLIIETQQAKSDYQNQKDIFEQKKQKAEALSKELEGYRSDLDQQKKDKDALLSQTKNDEAAFQRQLAAALAESQAIQGIISSGGNATKIGDIKEGDRVGQMIVGRSACSSGTHLHLEVHKNNVLESPANYLKDISVKFNTSPDPSFGFSGSWNWPLDGDIEIEQGFGMTYYARVYNAYGGGPHTGIDMYSYSSLSVKAVKDGVLYRGGVACGGGTLLFARVDQSDGIQVYYFHIVP
jgi:peptidoglycan hydrolase CwlO-like protein